MVPSPQPNRFPETVSESPCSLKSVGLIREIMSETNKSSLTKSPSIISLQPYKDGPKDWEEFGYSVGEKIKQFEERIQSQAKVHLPSYKERWENIRVPRSSERSINSDNFDNLEHQDQDSEIRYRFGGGDDEIDYSPRFLGQEDVETLRPTLMNILNGILFGLLSSKISTVLVFLYLQIGTGYGVYLLINMLTSGEDVAQFWTLVWAVGAFFIMTGFYLITGLLKRSQNHGKLVNFLVALVHPALYLGSPSPSNTLEVPSESPYTKDNENDDFDSDYESRKDSESPNSILTHDHYNYTDHELDEGYSQLYESARAETPQNYQNYDYNNHNNEIGASQSPKSTLVWMAIVFQLFNLLVPCLMWQESLEASYFIRGHIPQYLTLMGIYGLRLFTK